MKKCETQYLRLSKINSLGTKWSVDTNSDKVKAVKYVILIGISIDIFPNKERKDNITKSNVEKSQGGNPSCVKENPDVR